MALHEGVFIAMRSEKVAHAVQVYLDQKTSHEVVGRTSDLGMVYYVARKAKEVDASVLVLSTDFGSLGYPEGEKGIAAIFRRHSKGGIVVPVSFTPGEEISFGDVRVVEIDGSYESFGRLADTITNVQRPPTSSTRDR